MSRVSKRRRDRFAKREAQDEQPYGDGHVARRRSRDHKAGHLHEIGLEVERRGSPEQRHQDSADRSALDFEDSISYL